MSKYYTYCICQFFRQFQPFLLFIYSLHPRFPSSLSIHSFNLPFIFKLLILSFYSFFQPTLYIRTSHSLLQFTLTSTLYIHASRPLFQLTLSATFPSNSLYSNNNYRCSYTCQHGYNSTRQCPSAFSYFHTHKIHTHCIKNSFCTSHHYRNYSSRI